MVCKLEQSVEAPEEPSPDETGNSIRDTIYSVGVDQADVDPGGCFDGFAQHQTGKVGDMTAGLPPADYVSGSCYLEWYGE